MHEVKRNQHLKELYYAGGVDCGGTSVDMAFKQALAEIVTEGMLQGYCHKYTGDYLELLRDFEIKKRKCGLVNDSNPLVSLKVPVTFGKECTGRFFEELTTLTNKSRFKNHFYWKSGKVRIDMPTFEGFFQPTCNRIINHVEKLLNSQEVIDVKTILMVGGFSESPLLQDAIRKAFPDCQVIVPQEAGLAVLRGAVVFGYNPKAIDSRISRYTYGVKMNIKFDPEKHIESKKRLIDGVEYCKDIFDTHVVKGEELIVGEAQFQRFYVPLTLDQTQIRFNLYISDEQNPLYVDSAGCQKLGDLSIPVPVDKQDRSVEVHICFKETNITVEARYIQTGLVRSVSFDL